MERLIPQPYVDQLSESSGLISTSQVISNHKSVLVALLVYTDGVNDATVTLYDSFSGPTGVVLAKIVVSAADRVGGEVRIMCVADNGIYAQLNGTNAEALVRFSRGQ